MCGIVGVAGLAATLPPDPLGPALAALVPRGPDGGGRAEGRLGDQPVLLGARRLALVDVERGRQPFVRSSGSILVVNGEVYNHEALRRDLEARGERFTTRCDGEVLAALLDREGLDGLARVEGSFALAFLDARRGRLCLARDAHGVRPLAWARTRRSLVFASTVEALLATGLVPPEADPEAIADVLRDGVVRGERSAIAGVARLAPGDALEIDAELRVVRRSLPPPAPAEAEEPLPVLDALRAAVHDRLRLDRPAAVFLSGGVDSALVAALAGEVTRIPAYTVTYPGHGDVDEGRRAGRTAARLGLAHVEVPCPTDPTPWVLGAARAFDEPFADASAVATWGLARAASLKARAALTGTGGDEAFGGYRRYWLLGAGPWLRHVPAFAREPVAAALSRATPAGARVLRASGDPEGLYRGLLRLQPAARAVALAGPRVRPVLEAARPLHGPTTAVEAMRDDRARYLPDDLLVKEDRALMAHGVEGRHPYLDRRVLAAAARLEVHGSPGRGRQKQVLRAYVREVVDPDLSRVQKRGFAFPCDALYAGPLCPLAEEVLTAKRARDRGFMDVEETRRILREHLTGRRAHGAVLHALVALELWACRVLDRA